MATKPTSPLRRLLTVEETAQILNESTKATRRRIKSGELPHIRSGRLIRVHPDDLDRFIASRRMTGFSSPLTSIYVFVVSLLVF